MSWRKSLLIVLLGAVLAAGGLALSGTGPARTAWATYQSASINGDHFRAAALVASDVLASGEHARRLALTASAENLTSLTGLEASMALGLRLAVIEGRLPLDDIRKTSGGRQLHALLSKARRAHPYKDHDLIAVIRTGQRSATGWIGPKAHAGGWWSLAFAIGFGARIDMVREGDVWRINDLPLKMRLHDETVAIGASPSNDATPGQRKRMLEQSFAGDDLAKRQALWVPLEETAPTS